MIFSEYFDMHFFLLYFNEHVQFTKNRLNSFISTLVIMKKLLKIF